MIGGLGERRLRETWWWEIQGVKVCGKVSKQVFER